MEGRLLHHSDSAPCRRIGCDAPLRRRMQPEASSLRSGSQPSPQTCLRGIPNGKARDSAMPHARHTAPRDVRNGHADDGAAAPEDLGPRRFSPFRRPVSALMLALIWVYQNTLSRILPPSCRFVPSCSIYAAQAIRLHGPVKGLLLACWRVLRCNPFGGSGFDPVPPPRRKTQRKHNREIR